MVFLPAPRSAASMSRKSPTSRSSEGFALRAMTERAPRMCASVPLDEPVRRNRDADLAGFRADKRRQREQRAIANPADDPKHNEQSEQAWHLARSHRFTRSGS